MCSLCCCTPPEARAADYFHLLMAAFALYMATTLPFVAYRE